MKRYCEDCKRVVEVGLYNDRVSPTLMVCKECQQFCFEAAISQDLPFSVKLELSGNLADITETEYSDLIWEAFPITDLTLNTLGLCGEAGELANKIKKRIYQPIPDEDLLEELGDILWHLTQIARLLNTDLQALRTLSAKRTLEKNK